MANHRETPKRREQDIARVRQAFKHAGESCRAFSMMRQVLDDTYWPAVHAETMDEAEDKMKEVLAELYREERRLESEPVPEPAK